MTLLFADFARLQAAITGGQRRFGAFAVGRFPSGEALPSGGPEGTPLAFTGPGGAVLTLSVKAQVPGLAEMIRSTRIDDAEMAPLHAHGAHMLCFHRGQGDGFSRSLELFELAGALAEFDLLGAIHTPAQQCFRRDQILALLPLISEQRAAGADGALGQVLVNLIPLFGEGCTYYVTRGAQVLGTPEICIFDSSNALSMPQVNGMIAGLLSYIRGGAQFEIGHTSEYDGVHLTVEELDATYADYIRATPQDAVIQFRVGGGAQSFVGNIPAEGRLIVAGIVATAILVLTAEGSPKPKKLEAAIDQLLAKRSLPDLGPFFEAAVLNFEYLGETILKQDPQAILGLVGLAHEDVAQQHGDAAARTFAQTLYGLARTIAATAGGGLLSFGAKTSKNERATLDALAQVLKLDGG